MFLVVAMIIIFGLGALLLLAIAFYNRPKYKRSNILTDGELRFYKVLRLALKGEYFILAQVRLANIVELANRMFFWKNFNPLGAKTVDFVLMDKQTGKTILVIELDDKSHNLPSRWKRDRFVDRTLASANVPILHVPVEGYYQEEDLRKQIQARIIA